MTGTASDIAFTPAVKAWQERKGSRAAYARMEQKGGWQTIGERWVVGLAHGVLVGRGTFGIVTVCSRREP